MKFEQIELMEALRVIGEGSVTNLYYFKTTYGDLKRYGNYKIQASEIRDYKWFLRTEDGDTK